MTIRHLLLILAGSASAVVATSPSSSLRKSSDVAAPDKNNDGPAASSTRALRLNSLPATTDALVPLLDRARALSDTCPDPLIDDDFENETGLGMPEDYLWFPNGGSPTFSHVIDDGSSYLGFANRTSSSHGPSHRLDPACLSSSTTYVFSARFMLKTTLGDDSPSLCSQGSVNNNYINNNCVRVKLSKEDLVGGKKVTSTDNLGKMSEPSPPDGTWFDFSFEFQFNDDVIEGLDAGPDGIVERMLFVTKPEVGVDIYMDDVRLAVQTAAPTSTPTEVPTSSPTTSPTAGPTSPPVCSDPVSFVRFDGDSSNPAEDLGDWYTTGGANLMYKTEYSHAALDKYVVVGERSKKSSGLRLELDPTCIVVGEEYVFKALVKLDKTDGTTTTCESGDGDCLQLQYIHDDNGDVTRNTLVEMTSTEASGEWHVFTATVKFDAIGDLSNSRLDLKGAEVGVDVSLDDLYFGLAAHIPTAPPTAAPTGTPTGSPTPAPACPALLNTAEFDDEYTTGGWFPTGGSELQYNTNGGNTAHKNRGKSTHALKLDLLDDGFHIDCIIPGKLYYLTVELKIGTSTGDSEKFALKYLGTDTGTDDRNSYTIEPLKDELDGDGNFPSNKWFTYTAHFKFDDSIHATTAVKREIYFTGAAADVEIKFDNLRFGIVVTEEPTPSPTDTPTEEGYMPPMPAGPYVSAEMGSHGEKVTLPDPEYPVELLGTARYDCPHLDANVKSWHDTNTWGGSLPAAGHDVTLPEDTHVLVSQTVAVTLGIVTVPLGSSLIFGENSDGIAFDAIGMSVHGSLIAGSEMCRLETKLIITLHGDRPTDLDMQGQSASTDVSYKGISVSGVGARIDLHGKRYYRTWTRLAATAQPGDQVVLLQHATNWRAGQEIVLVTSAMKDSRDFNLNEVRTIRAVVTEGEYLPKGAGAAVYLTEPVEYQHAANANYQVEVGLLTREIVVRGSEDSEPTLIDDGTYEDGRNIYGTKGAPDPTKELDGYGGHMIVHNGATGYVEGVELHRMGQTNVMGRYPMHFHILGNDCPDCYFKDSSVHRSYFRCISIHGTHNTTVTENVAFDVTGFCYYLEDGVEEDNTISFNLAAHIHFLGKAPVGSGQNIPYITQTEDMVLPADAAASGFYITNVHNDIIGNAASGGWSGFAFPTLFAPLGHHRSVNMRPSIRTSKTIDGNTAHSSGWWWGSAGAFYNGGTLFYDKEKPDLLVYNAGRHVSMQRSPCKMDMCTVGLCNWGCPVTEQAWVRFTNTKAFLVPGVGFNSWAGRAEMVGYEAHDVGKSVAALSPGFWLDDMLCVCRTGHDIVLPSGGKASNIKADGFFWYDTAQEHIITNSIFRHCGYRSENYEHWDKSTTRGCGDEEGHGCSSQSTVFGFLTHSDTFNPNVMQATKNIKFEDCGRRFYLRDYRAGNDNAPDSTTSGRLQNWIDADGSVSGLNEPTLIGSGQPEAGLWWDADEQIVRDPDGPLIFLKKDTGPARGIGHILLHWDAAVHGEVGDSGVCGNGPYIPCNAEGYIKHFGPRFASDQGLPVTAPGAITGPTGGYGWLLELEKGAPTVLDITRVELDPKSHILMGIQYPLGTTFNIYAGISHWKSCTASENVTCKEIFKPVDSLADVRKSLGNVYHVDAKGFLTFRVIMTAEVFTGTPKWFIPDLDTQYEGKNGKEYALKRFSRGGLTLPTKGTKQYLRIEADCPSEDGFYCDNTPKAESPHVCPNGYEQVSYDTCCSLVFPGVCDYVALTA